MILPLTARMVDYDGAHKAGWNDGIDGEQNKYPQPINDYQKEYNRGFGAGDFFREK